MSAGDVAIIGMLIGIVIATYMIKKNIDLPIF